VLLTQNNRSGLGIALRPAPAAGPGRGWTMTSPSWGCYSGIEVTAGLPSLFCGHPQCVNDPRDIEENTQQDVDHQVLAGAFLEKHRYGRQQN